jgi:hypothetical protein
MTLPGDVSELCDEAAGDEIGEGLLRPLPVVLIDVQHEPPNQKSGIGDDLGEMGISTREIRKR